jgi:hypothetical protein
VNEEEDDWICSSRWARKWTGLPRLAFLYFLFIFVEASKTCQPILDIFFENQNIKSGFRKHYYNPDII